VDIDTLARSPLGQLVPIHGRDARRGEFAYFAYLPKPLPDNVDLDSATWSYVVQAATALGRLDLACTKLRDPRLLIRPALWREALDTSALEGTHGGLQELLEAQLPSAQFLSPETVEIRAYERVALMAFALVKDREIGMGFLSELQRELLKDSRKPPRDLGAVRQDHVWIGGKDRPIDEARYVPPPADDRLRAGLDSWELWVRTRHPHLPPVLQAALAHYQFEALHPFGDGNGRIGRLIVVLQLLRSGSIQQPAVTVSPWFLKRRDEYQQQLLRVSLTGDWNPWVQFFCQAISDQCESLLARAQKLVDWLDEGSKTLLSRRWAGVIHKLLEDLVEWPVITIADTADRYGVTTVHAARMINHLVEIGVLKELTGKSYGRIFGATYVMETVDSI
jgi:Fic family protein